MDPLYDFMGTVMDEPSEVSRYIYRSGGPFYKIFSKYYAYRYLENDKLLRVSIDHLGMPQRWIMRQNIVMG